MDAVDFDYVISIAEGIIKWYDVIFLFFSCFFEDFKFFLLS